MGMWNNLKNIKTPGVTLGELGGGFQFSKFSNALNSPAGGAITGMAVSSILPSENRSRDVTLGGVSGLGFNSMMKSKHVMAGIGASFGLGIAASIATDGKIGVSEGALYASSAISAGAFAKQLYNPIKNSGLIGNSKKKQFWKEFTAGESSKMRYANSINYQGSNTAMTETNWDLRSISNPGNNKLKDAAKFYRFNETIG